MKTYAQWREQAIQAIAQKYKCTMGEAAQCIDNWRWWRECIEPAMKAGEQPNEDVAKSLVKHCPYSMEQLCKMFWSWHGRDFLPISIAFDGKVIR